MERLREIERDREIHRDTERETEKAEGGSERKGEG